MRNKQRSFAGCCFWHAHEADTRLNFERTEEIVMTKRLLGASILALVLSFSMSGEALAQGTGTIAGTVTDAGSGEPLPGVNVVVEGTQQGAATAADGTYEITGVEAGTHAVTASFVGYADTTRQGIEVQANQTTTVDFALEQEAAALEEMVVVGYGEQERVSITGAVSSISDAELDEINTVNATQLLQGQLPGLHTKQTSGQPGAEGISFNIRGFGNPLVLVDGVERDLSDVAPESIESISVLKDASAAVYGARAGNGVILVTTKRGGFEQPLQISYEGSYSAEEFTNKPEIITDAGTYLELFTEAEKNAGLTPTYSEETIGKYKKGVEGYESYNWFDYAFKDYSAKSNHTLSFTGGSKDVKYYASAGFSNKDGMIASDDWNYERYNLRANVDGQVTGMITASLDLNYVNERQSEARSQMWRGVYKSQPMAPTNFPDTSLNPVSNLTGTHQRLVGEMNKDIEGGWTRNRDKIYGSVSLKYETPFVNGLSMSSTFDFQRHNFRDRQNLRQWEVYRRNPETGAYTLDGRFPAHVVGNMLELNHDRYTLLKPSFKLDYSRDIGRHSIESLFVAEYTEEKSNDITAQTENLLSDELELLFTGDPTYHNVNQWAQDMSRGSLVGSAKYSFNDRYLADATVRYDGSSIFPSDRRWGLFPSVSVAWRISEEPFAKTSILDNLKLRASYSEMGFDDNAIPYDHFAGYNIMTNPPYIFGAQINRRVERGSLPNKNMTWEDMTTYNIGLDFSLWQSKLAGHLDVFYRKRSNILTTPVSDIPNTFGASLPQQNLNSMDDRGIELGIRHSNVIGDVNYSIDANATYSRSKWIHFEEEEYTTIAEKRVYQQSGRWVNRSIGYVSEGIFRSQEQIDNHPVDQDQAGNETIIPGDIIYRDLNDDGVITWKDQKVIGRGTGMPDLGFGLDLSVSYGNASLDVLLQGASLFSGYVSGFTQVPFLNTSTPLEVHREERFHPKKNPDGSLPAITMGERSHNTKFSDFWLKNVTYLSVKNINLGYSLPENLVSLAGINNLRLYISVNNLAKFNNLGIWSNAFDPETGLSHQGYPPHRSYTFGINIDI